MEKDIVKHDTVPEFNSKERECLFCGRKMFYSAENLVHVCLEESHGVLCFFEPDSCWFAAKKETADELARMNIKYHFIPQEVFDNAGLKEFTCEYNDHQKK